MLSSGAVEKGMEPTVKQIMEGLGPLKIPPAVSRD